MAGNDKTLDEARALLTGNAGERDVLSFVKRRGTEYLNTLDKSETARGQAMAAAALATHVASERSVLLPEGKREDSTTGGAMGARNFVIAFAGTKEGDKPAVSPTNVPHWRTLGYLIMVVGCPVEFAKRGEDKSTWQLASQSPGDVLKNAVFAEGATVESVREALLTIKRPDGSRIAPANAGGAGTPRQGEPEGATLAESVAEDPIGVALTAIGALDVACKAIPEGDTDGWAKVEDAINRVLTREVTLRRKFAETLAKKTAASKRTAAKKTASSAA